MSDEIKEGDLVRVAYPTPCCGKKDGANEVFYVAEIIKSILTDYCAFCNRKMEPGTLGARKVGTNYIRYVSRLKRIDPPAVNDEVETQMEVTA